MGEKGERPERVFPRQDRPVVHSGHGDCGGRFIRGVYCVFPELESRAPMGLARAATRPGLRGPGRPSRPQQPPRALRDRLVVVYAGTRSVIPYAHVRGVLRTRTLWAGTANSLDRVYIEAPYDGDVIVSVTDNDALVAKLGRRCGLGPGCEQGN